MGARSRDSHLWRFVQYLICLSAKKCVLLCFLKPEQRLNVHPLFNKCKYHNALFIHLSGSYFC